jgi:hypothetical protein
MNIPPPQIEPILSQSIWQPTRYRLTADWVITLDDGLPLLHPRGFETDFASTPRLMWAIPGFAPNGPLLHGGIVHDLFYQYQYCLSPYSKKRQYPEISMRLREEFYPVFGDLIPVFVGRNQRFGDDLLAGITIEATGKVFIARSAEMALHLFGVSAWNKYRTLGPTAYNSNSLGLPGITTRGPIF